MFYSLIKIIHITSATVLFGVGMTLSLCYVMIHISRDLHYMVRTNFHIMMIEWICGLTAGMIQLITGFMMIDKKGLALTSDFWLWTLLGYTMAGLCWLGALYVQWHGIGLLRLILHHRSIERTSSYKFYFRIRVLLSMMGFTSLTVVIYWMTHLATVN